MILTQAPRQLRLETVQPLDYVLEISPEAGITLLNIVRQARDELDVRLQLLLQSVDMQFLVPKQRLQRVVVRNNRGMNIQLIVERCDPRSQNIAIPEGCNAHPRRRQHNWP